MGWADLSVTNPWQRSAGRAGEAKERRRKRRKGGVNAEEAALGIGGTPLA
jgi:hypothetical protein